MPWYPVAFSKCLSPLIITLHLLAMAVPPKNSIQPVRKHKAQAQVANLNDLPRRALRTTMRISGQAFALRLKKPPRQTLPVSDRCRGNESDVT